MSESHPVVDELRAAVGDDAVISDPDQLLVYECDGFPIARGMPVAVVFPTNTAQVMACVRALTRHALQIVPRGSGTGLAGGAVSYEPGVIIVQPDEPDRAD